ncbi:MAG: NAD(P)/FAD-dependent oxidoreductase, partial [Christensenellaceae bacterium]|nr:NAD(P)/FAD-dependent oxidoreductase [Christensenellaceae bacterium]
LKDKKERFPSLTFEDLLTGVLHNRLGRTVLRYCGYRLDMPVTDLDDDMAADIADGIKNFELPLKGTCGFDAAQVTAGGADTSQFDPETLESKLTSGLYAAGEVLDVDGDCGGYNLQWAWSSGMCAGMRCAK